MLSSDPAGARRVINFTDPESQKGFVYSPFLSPATRYPSPTLMGSRVSSLLVDLPPFFFSRHRVSPFIYLLTLATPAYLCPFPHFQPCSGVYSHCRERRLDSAHRYGGTVKIGQWPKTSIFRFSHRGEETGRGRKISAAAKRPYK